MVPRGLQNLKKWYQKYDASWLGIWSPLGTDFGGFWRQVGRQVGTKLAYLGALILSYLTLSYLTLPYLVLSYLGYLGYLGHKSRAEGRGLGPTGLLREYPQEALQDRFLKPTWPQDPLQEGLWKPILDDFSLIWGDILVDFWFLCWSAGFLGC